MSRADGPAARARRSRVRRARQTLPSAALLQTTPTSPPPADVPVETERTTLYTAAELYGTREYAASLDARVYAWSLAPSDRRIRLAQALHDHAIDEALDAWLEGRHLVGVMGGHDAQRGDPSYARAARLGHGLGAGGLVVATGGGPGAMEAANLGCLMAERPVDDLDAAVARLAQAAAFRPVDTWLDAARAELAVLTGAGEESAASLHASLGVPTWFYGHEPTNLFATAVAKYFRNAQREAILLRLCDAGIVFLPGAAGTVQEIFQDACENYYAVGETVAPMVLVGTEFWTATLPAWPLLHSLGQGRDLARSIHLVDDVDEAVALLTGVPTDRTTGPR